MVLRLLDLPPEILGRIVDPGIDLSARLAVGCKKLRDAYSERRAALFDAVIRRLVDGRDAGWKILTEPTVLRMTTALRMTCSATFGQREIVLRLKKKRMSVVYKERFVRINKKCPYRMIMRFYPINETSGVVTTKRTYTNYRAPIGDYIVTKSVQLAIGFPN